MYSEPSCVVHGALALSLRASRLCGVAPLRMTREAGGWRVSCFKHLTTYGYIVLSLLYAGYAANFYFNVLMTLAAKDHVNIPNNTLEMVVEMVSVTLVVTVGIYGAPSRMEKIIECFNVIQKSSIPRSQKCERKSSDWKNYTFAIFIIFLAYAHILMFLSVYIREIYNTDKDGLVLTLYTGFNVHIIVVIFVELQFFQVSQAIAAEFSNINDSLQELAKAADTVQTHWIPVLEKSKSNMNSVASINMLVDTLAFRDKKVKRSSPDTEDAVRQLNRCIGILSGLVREIGRSYGMFLLLNIGVILYVFIMTPYYLVFVLRDSTPETSSRLFYILITNVIRLVMINEPGHRINVEFGRARIILGHWISRELSNESRLAFELELLYMQIESNAVSYSPFGVCKLRRALVLTIFTAAATYMVVLLRFV